MKKGGAIYGFPNHSYKLLECCYGSANYFVTQIIKIFLKVPKKYVPSIAIALALGLIISVLHKLSTQPRSWSIYGRILWLRCYWFICIIENNNFII